MLRNVCGHASITTGEIIVEGEVTSRLRDCLPDLKNISFLHTVLLMSVVLHLFGGFDCILESGAGFCCESA